MFITFEGGEGSGKTTQAALLARWLVQQGYPVVLVKEPGSTGLGRLLRPILKGSPMVPTAELLLFGAARAELVAGVIWPHSSRGRIVISDRFADSTTAYQGYGRGLPLAQVEAVNRIASQGVTPDATILLDLRPEQQKKRTRVAQMAMPLGMGREEAARVDRDNEARFELESLQFRRKVRAGYRKLAAQEPARWIVIDAEGDVEEIHRQVREAVSRRLPGRPGQPAELLDLTGSEGKARHGG